MTDSERAELLLGIRSAGDPPYGPRELGKSEMHTYAPLIAWTGGRFFETVQKLAETIEAWEAANPALNVSNIWRSDPSGDTLSELPEGHKTR